MNGMIFAFACIFSVTVGLVFNAREAMEQALKVKRIKPGYKSALVAPLMLPLLLRRAMSARARATL